MKNESLKEKIFTIIVTAAISAAIALLQTLLTHYLNSNAPTPDPEVAGGIGAALRTGYYFLKARA